MRWGLGARGGVVVIEAVGLGFENSLIGRVGRVCSQTPRLTHQYASLFMHFSNNY